MYNYPAFGSLQTIGISSPWPPSVWTPYGYGHNSLSENASHKKEHRVLWPTSLQNAHHEQILPLLN
ncbi:hypothetical protein D3C71_1350840 [compost metagenome]